VARLRDGVPDISVRSTGAPSVAGQECGNGVVIDHGAGWETQYCHVARGSLAVKVGDTVKAGQPLARVGLSGATEFPHLHFTVRHAGQIVDPFAPDMNNSKACTAQAPLWSPAAAQQMRYKAGVILNVGFAGGPVSMEAVEAGGVAAPAGGSPYLVAYARFSELEQGDRVEIRLSAPDGATLAAAKTEPLNRDKAQYIHYVGKKRPATGWPHGRYLADIKVLRAGTVALTRRIELAL
jgi:hypothetical protein